MRIKRSVRIRNDQNGFTLIELMVVVAIVSVLAAIVKVKVNSLISKSRDKVRKATLATLAETLSAYYADHESYPITTGARNSFYSSETGDINYDKGPANNGQWIPGLTPKYLANLPTDPLGGMSQNPNCTGAGASKNAYLYRSDDGTGYKLLAFCGPEIRPWPASDPFDDPQRSMTGAWMVCSGPTACAY